MMTDLEGEISQASAVGIRNWHRFWSWKELDIEETAKIELIKMVQQSSTNTLSSPKRQLCVQGNRRHTLFRFLAYQTLEAF